MITDRFSTFVNPKLPIPFRIEQLTSINDSMVIGCTRLSRQSFRSFWNFARDAVMVAHNADFDMSFIIENCRASGTSNRNILYVDTVAMARFLLPALNRFKLDTVAKAVGVSLDHHHRAVDDAACTAEIFVRFVEMLRERDILDARYELNEQGDVSVNTIQKLPTYHAIILAKNETGRVNLYKLVCQSHLKYYAEGGLSDAKEPVLESIREGLMIGSCLRGRRTVSGTASKCTGTGDRETGQFL